MSLTPFAHAYSVVVLSFKFFIVQSPILDVTYLFDNLVINFIILL